MFGASRPGRAGKRYADARGGILAAGVGYFAFFSIFPAIALAFTVFGFVLRGGTPTCCARSLAIWARTCRAWSGMASIPKD